MTVYIAGPISGATMQFLRNVDEGLEWTAKVRAAGFAPFPVFSDFMDIMRVTETVDVESVKAQSIAWMLKADAVLMLPRYRESAGAIEELRIARLNNIRVFFDLDEMIEYRKRWLHERMVGA